MTTQPYPLQYNQPAYGHQPYQPPAPPGDASTLAAQGQPIRLLDGRTVQLRFSMASLRLLEARFGSLVGIQTELARAQKAMEAAQEEGAQLRAEGPIFTILTDAIAPGLYHERAQDLDAPGTPLVRLGTRPDLVAELLDPGHLQEYLDAFAKALGEAFGSLGKAPAPAAQTGPPPGSPGGTGTTSPPSSADAQTGSSGA